METRTYNGYTYQRASASEPWALVGPAAASATQMPVITKQADPKRPYEGPQAAATLQATQAGIAAEQERIRLAQEALAAQRERDAKPTLPAGYRMGAGGVAERIPGLPADKEGGKDADLQSGQLDALVNQINEMQGIYAEGAGATKGVSGIYDFLPSGVNSRFDAAANALEERATSAFRVPGQGGQSDADAARIAAANKPNRFAFDSATAQQLKQLRERVDTTRKALGLAPAEWKGFTAPATGATKTERDPKRAAALNALIRSGADIDTINDTMTGMGGSPVSPGDIDAARAYLKKNPGFKGSLADATNTTQTSAREKVSGSDFGAFMGRAINDGLAGLPSAAMDNRDVLDQQAKAHPEASVAGSLIGSTAGAAGAELGLAATGAKLGGGAIARLLSNSRFADAAFGGVSGATITPDDPLMGAATGAGLSVAGGLVGDKVFAGVGKGLRGVQDPSARYLYNRKVPLTAGQAAGGTLKGLEDRLTGVSGLGDIVNARRNEGLDVYRRAAFDDATVPLQSQTTPLNVNTVDTGARGIEQLGAIRSQGYSNAVAGRSAAVDPQFQNEYVTAHQAAQAIPNTGGMVADEINATVPGYFDNGVISGENAQAAIRELKGIRTARQTDPLGFRTGEAVRQAEGAVTNLFERQSPGFANDLAAANRTNANYKTLEAAVKAAKNNGEDFMPSQLNAASVASAAKFGGNPTSPSRPFYELATAGQKVLPSKVADSGTAGRLALLALPGALGGGYQGSDSLSGAATGAAAGGTISSLLLAGVLAGGGSKPVQRAIVRALMERNAGMVQAGEALVDSRAIGGILGAGVGSGIPALLAQP